MSPRIVLVPPSADIGEIAREMAPTGFELVLARDGSAEYEAALAGAEYMVCYPNVALRDAFYRAAPRVKLVQLLSAGYDAVDLEAARRARVPVANNGGANAISVAEHALMLMLAVSRKVIWQHANVAGGRWRGNGPAPRMYELYNKTLGIIGLGTIGKKVARLAQAFGMRVQYYDIVRLSEDAEDALGVRFRLLRELLRSSDVVSLHVPLNASTRGMIGAGELALMKPSAVLINTSRGPVVDEPALTRALSEAKLLGAGLDVFDQEPPPADNPLLKLDNVVLTAHFAGPTWDNHVARFRNAFDNVQRVARAMGRTGAAVTGWSQRRPGKSLLPLGRRWPVEPKARLRRDGPDEGAFATNPGAVAPHQLGRMTYGCAIEEVHVGTACRAAVSHGLASSPPKGERGWRRRSWSRGGPGLDMMGL
jgi:phosphoglycerate dehydrogenase-like enzyme